jgi:hypothetical protein
VRTPSASSDGHTFALCGGGGGGAPPPIDGSHLLTETSFIMTHDSATGYLDGNSHPMVETGGETNFDARMKTQTAAHCAPGAQSPGANFSFSFADQLDCGARAFDLRPTVQPGGVRLSRALRGSPIAFGHCPLRGV